jgi:holo-[acyl-carrier protein] synthase
MKLSTGVDAIEIGRIAAALERFGARFEQRVYTPRELAFCRGRVVELAARFAAKEAVSKALGTGIRGVAWREIEILPNRRGKPQVYLYGRALARAADLGLTHFEISLTHTDELAIAFVVAFGDG